MQLYNLETGKVKNKTARNILQSDTAKDVVVNNVKRKWNNKH